MKIKSTAIIRDRGQLTLPEKIRETFRWARPSSVVIIYAEKPDEITIRPYPEKSVDWGQLWKDIARVRSYRGKGRGSLSEFIAKDRETRS